MPEGPLDVSKLLAPHAPPQALDHRWRITGHGRQTLAELRENLEKERDHYANTTLVAGPDPRAPNEKLRVYGWENVWRHQTAAIAGALAAIEASEEYQKDAATKFRVQINGHTIADPPQDGHGNETLTGITVAEKYDRAEELAKQYEKWAAENPEQAAAQKLAAMQAAAPSGSERQ